MPSRAYSILVSRTVAWGAFQSQIPSPRICASVRICAAWSPDACWRCSAVPASVSVTCSSPAIAPCPRDRDTVDRDVLGEADRDAHVALFDRHVLDHGAVGACSSMTPEGESNGPIAERRSVRPRSVTSGAVIVTTEPSKFPSITGCPSPLEGHGFIDRDRADVDRLPARPACRRAGVSSIITWRCSAGIESMPSGVTT